MLAEQREKSRCYGDAHCDYSPTSFDPFLNNPTLLKGSPPVYPPARLSATRSNFSDVLRKLKNGVVASGKAEFDLDGDFTARTTRDVRLFLGIPPVRTYLSVDTFLPFSAHCLTLVQHRS
jgi:hypothetical protein